MAGGSSVPPFCFPSLCVLPMANGQWPKAPFSFLSFSPYALRLTPYVVMISACA